MPFNFGQYSYENAYITIVVSPLDATEEPLGSGVSSLLLKRTFDTCEEIAELCICYWPEIQKLRRKILSKE